MLFMADAADNASGKTGLTLTITLSKDGGTFSSITPTITERGNGWYALSLTASHTDTLGDFALHVTGTNAVPTDILALVVASLPGNDTARFDTIDATLAIIASYIDTEVAAIKAKTDNLPANTTTRLDTIDASIAALPGYSLKKNFAQSGFPFPMYLSTDGSPATGLTVSLEISQDGSAFTASTNSSVELNGGWYKINLTASELNGKKIAIRASGTGARRTDFEFTTQD